MTPLHLRVTTYRVADRSDRKAGLLAFLAIDLDDAVRIEGVTLRRTLAGKLTLAFPRRNDRHGHSIDLVHPISTEARDRIEREVFAQLGVDAPWVAPSTRSGA